METEELYRGLRQLQDKGAYGNAYNGCDSPTSELNYVLDDFYMYIVDKYKDSMPLWAEAFVQIYSWQFQTMHESAEAYYENLYGIFDYQTILRVADYLQKNGYDEIAQPYASAAVDCEPCHYPADHTNLLPDDWIDNNVETIWKFYVDILEKNRNELMQS